MLAEIAVRAHRSRAALAWRMPNAFLNMSRTASHRPPRLDHCLLSAFSALCAITLALAALLLAGCVPLPPAPWSPALREPVLAPTVAHLKIVTANVNLHGRGHEATAAALRATHGDVLVLQETSAAWEQYLNNDPVLSARYPHRRFRHDWSAGGQAILSRWSIRELAWIEPPSGGYPGWLVEIESPLGPLQVLGLHLSPPLTKTGHWRAARAIAAPDDRRREMQHFWQETEPFRSPPLVVLGDFNEQRNGKAIRWLRSSTNLRSAVDPFDPTTASWRWRAFGAVPLARRIDHIFVSADLQVFAAGVQTPSDGPDIPTPGSDHRPVWAVLGLAEALEDEDAESDRGTDEPGFGP